MSELYKRMKAKGINMGWYEHGRRGRSNDHIPLDDDVCSALSIYLLKKDGSLWTITHKGAVYQQVRAGSKDLPKEVYVCLHCKAQWNDAPVNKEGDVKHPANNQ